MPYERRLPIRREIRLRRLLARAAIVVLLAAVSALSLVIFLQLDYFLISQIRVYGTQKVAASAINQAISQNLAGNYLGLAPRRNIFLLNPQELSEKISRNFPRVASIDFDRQLPNKLFALVEEREPFFSFCSAAEPDGQARLPDGQASGTPRCFQTDQSGYIFDTVTSPADLIELAGPWPDNLSIGQPVFGPEPAELLVGLIEVIKSAGASPSKVTWDGRLKYEVETAAGWRVIFSADATSSLPATLQRVFSSEVISGRPGGLKNLDYIDLRFGNKIFLKFK